MTNCCLSLRCFCQILVSTANNGADCTYEVKHNDAKNDTKHPQTKCKAVCLV